MKDDRWYCPFFSAFDQNAGLPTNHDCQEPFYGRPAPSYDASIRCFGWGPVNPVGRYRNLVVAAVVELDRQEIAVCPSDGVEQ